MVHPVVASTKDTTKEGDVKMDISLVGKSNKAALGDKELNVDGHNDKIEANDTIKTSYDAGRNLIIIMDACRSMSQMPPHQQ